MNSLEIDKLKVEDAKQRDAKEFSLGDTLDVKASVVVVVIVFLATQSDEFFRSHLGVWATRLQYVSVATLVLAGIFAFIELYPRRYATDSSLQDFEKWLRDLEIHYRKEEKQDKDKIAEQTLEQAIKGIYQKAKERVETNLVINKRKSFNLYCCFLCTAISLAANLLTLASRGFS